MDWQNERYVRLYTRDTMTWRLLRWEGQAVFALLLRRVDRAGVIDLAGYPAAHVVEAMTGIPPEVVAVGLAALERRGVVEIGAEAIVFPNFIEAQEAAASDAQRQRESRAKRRDRARRVITERDTTDPPAPEPVTKCDTTVTPPGEAEQNVTPSLAEPSVPSRAEEEEARERDLEERQRRAATIPIADPVAAASDPDTARVRATAPPPRCRAWGPSDLVGINLQIRAHGLEHVEAVVAFVKQAIVEGRRFGERGAQPKDWSNLWKYDGDPWDRWDQRFAEQVAADKRAKEREPAAELEIEAEEKKQHASVPRDIWANARGRE